jgi:hypothetical protein
LPTLTAGADFALLTHAEASPDASNTTNLKPSAILCKHQQHQNGFLRRLTAYDPSHTCSASRRELQMQWNCPRVQRASVQSKCRTIPPSRRASSHKEGAGCEEATPEAESAAVYMVESSVLVPRPESERDSGRVVGAIERARERSYFEGQFGASREGEEGIQDQAG